MINAKKWLDQNYPPKDGICQIQGINFRKKRDEVKKLDISKINRSFFI